jgi:hypothetical protein
MQHNWVKQNSDDIMKHNIAVAKYVLPVLKLKYSQRVFHTCFQGL